MDFVATKNRHGNILNCFSFRYHRSKNFKKALEFTVGATDGREVRYQYEEKKRRYLLKRVQSPQFPDITYEYERDLELNLMQLTQRKLPDARFSAHFLLSHRKERYYPKHD